VIRNGLPDPDSGPYCHQNMTTSSVGHAAPHDRIQSKSIVNFFDNPVNPDLGLWTPPDPDNDSDRHQNVIAQSLGHTPPLRKISSKSVHNLFSNPTDRQTNENMILLRFKVIQGNPFWHQSKGLS